LLPAQVDFVASLCLPGFLLLKQPQSFADHFVNRLEITSGYFAPDEIFKGRWQAHVHYAELSRFC